MKKLVSLALALVLILGVTVIPASAAFKAPNGTALSEGQYCYVTPGTHEFSENFNDNVFLDLGMVCTEEGWCADGYRIAVTYKESDKPWNFVALDFRESSDRALYAEYVAKWEAMKAAETTEANKTTTAPVATPAPTPTPTPVPTATPAPTPTIVSPELKSPNGNVICDCICDDAALEAINRFDENIFLDLGLIPNLPVWNWDTNGHIIYIYYREPGERYGQGINFRTEEGRALYAEYEAKWRAMKAAEADKTDTAPIATSEETPLAAHATTEQYFDDVAPDAWYADAVNAMTASGIIKGKSDGLFHPEDNVTVGELCTIIYRIGKNEDPTGWQVDLTNYERWDDTAKAGATHWAAYALRTLNSTSLSYTTCTYRNIDDIVNRGETVKAIMALIEDAKLIAKGRYTQVANYTETDNDIPDWDAIASSDRYNLSPHIWWPDRILTAYNFGIIHGIDDAGTFNPAGNLTRAELCQMLANAGLTKYTPAPMRNYKENEGGVVSS